MARKAPAPECDCCGFTGPVGGVSEYPRAGGRMKSLCQLCANTMAGLTLDASPGTLDAATLRAVCYAANQIRRDIAGP